MKIAFTKMHGLGNDFAVVDATEQPFTLTSDQIKAMGHRRTGVGFDQLLVLESTASDADFLYRIFNADGGEVEQCGNGARCIARYVKENGYSCDGALTLQMKKGMLSVEVLNEHEVCVEMGVPAVQAAPITLTIADEQVAVGLVDMGNPHAIIQVPEISSERVAKLGAKIATHPHFPEGVNVGFMQVDSPKNAHLAVYERGVGPTEACGSGACAAMAWGRVQGILESTVVVAQPGGNLTIEWQGGKAPLSMTGPAEFVYRGEWFAVI